MKNKSNKPATTSTMEVHVKTTEMEYIERASFTLFKTDAKSISIYRVLRCCVLLQKSKFIMLSNGLG